MTHRTSIENAYYGHDHDMFHSELRKLLADKERLDYLEGIRARMEQTGLAWDTVVIHGPKNCSKSVREQIDDERRPHPAWSRVPAQPAGEQELPLVHRWLSPDAQKSGRSDGSVQEE